MENVILENKVERYIRLYDNGICPKCESISTYKNPYRKNQFYGCTDCLYGFWSKLVEPRFRPEPLGDIEIKAWIEHDKIHNKTNVAKVKKKRKPDAIQPKLF